MAMDVSTVTVLGNVTAEPKVNWGEGELPDRVSFRVVANQRRFDRQTETWVEAGEYSVNVVCWRQLARGVAGSVHQGDPVLVVGRINERQYEVDGVRRFSTEVTASFVGHDLNRGRSDFRRFRREAVPADAADGSAAGVATGSGDGVVSMAAADEAGDGSVRQSGLTPTDASDPAPLAGVGEGVGEGAGAEDAAPASEGRSRRTLARV